MSLPTKKRIHHIRPSGAILFTAPFPLHFVLLSTHLSLWSLCLIFTFLYFYYLKVLTWHHADHPCTRSRNRGVSSPPDRRYISNRRTELTRKFYNGEASPPQAFLPSQDKVINGFNLADDLSYLRGSADGVGNNGKTPLICLNPNIEHWKSQISKIVAAHEEHNQNNIASIKYYYHHHIKSGKMTPKIGKPVQRD